MKRRAIYCLCTLMIVMLSACKHDQPERPSGSFVVGDKLYNISALRIATVEPIDNKFLLRFSATPSTYTINETGEKGWGTYIDIYFLSEIEPLENGVYSAACVNNDSLQSVVRSITSQSPADTTTFIVKRIELTIDSTETFRSYTFTLTLEEGEVTGKYKGPYIYNFLSDRPSFGELSFDTLSATLAAPTMWEWGALFSGETDYHELVIYAADARFRDNGVIMSGLQLSLGFFCTDSILRIGTYAISETPDDATLFFGHKENNTPWGTYWQVFERGNAIGRANVVDGYANVLGCSNSTIDITFSLTDQLGNQLLGDYVGPYSIRHYETTK